MKRALRSLSVAAALGCALAACTDSRGRIQPLETGLLVGGLGLAAGTLGGVAARDGQRGSYGHYGRRGHAGGYYGRDAYLGRAPGNYGQCSYYGGCY